MDLPNRDNIKIIFHGGDNMFGRAIQLTLPHQTQGADKIKDTATAIEYLHWAIDDIDIEHIREDNIDCSYLWGDILNMNLEADVRIMNAETAFTNTTKNPYPNKEVRYYTNINNLKNIVSPFKNEPVVLCLANNHTMDFGPLNFNYGNIKYAGIGQNYSQAIQPAIINVNGNRLLIFSFAAGCSGTPENWAATDDKPGLVYLQPVINRKNVRDNFLIVDSAIKKYARNNDIILISVHWGPNWGNDNDGSEYRHELAHMLIDQSNVNIIYGHSSHHIRGMEIYKDKLIIYGAGDFINDYESIENPGQEKYNKDGMLVLVTLNINGDFSGLEIQPTYVQNLQVKLVSNKTRINKLIQDINRWSEHDVGNNNYPLILQ